MWWLQIQLPPGVQDTITVFLAIVIEASPFLVLGTLLSAIAGRVLAPDFFFRVLPQRRWLQHLLIPLAGLVFPVCECGNVPTTKKLMQKGMGVPQAFSFFLGAPILNIAVILSTVAAFSGMPGIVWGRFIGGWLLAAGVGYLLNFLPKSWLQFDLGDGQLSSDCVHCVVDAQHTHKVQWREFFSRSFAREVSGEFAQMFRYLLIGAALAALTQIWLPREVLLAVAVNPVLAILAMAALAFIISVCSTVDAFVALGYVGRVSPAALLAFLWFGPLIDIKALAMLRSFLPARLLWTVTYLVTAGTLLLAFSLAIVGF